MIFDEQMHYPFAYYTSQFCRPFFCCIIFVLLNIYTIIPKIYIFDQKEALNVVCLNKKKSGCSLLIGILNQPSIALYYEWGFTRKSHHLNDLCHLFSSLIRVIMHRSWSLLTSPINFCIEMEMIKIP